MVKASHSIELTIDKLVHGGQGLGTLDDGRKAFVWNALPGDRVRARITRKKRDFVEAITEEVLVKSALRSGDGAISDEDLSTRPWAIMGSINGELDAKADIVKELFGRENVKLPKFEVKTFGQLTNYRNKMEYCFWGDDEGLHLAHYKRGSHGKIKIRPQDSALGDDHLNTTAAVLLDALNAAGVRASQLKSVIVRSVMYEDFQAACALFVKDKDFPRLSLPQNTVVYFSDPKSPASVPTKELYKIGSTTLEQTILGRKLYYDVLSFFQVNKPIFEKALEDIRAHLLRDVPIVDMYAGVGTIGLSLASQDLTLVDVDPFNVAMAKKNVQDDSVKVVQASTEQVLEYVTPDCCLILDPPRSGLHKKLVQKIIDARPKQVVYLSCNPATQARDIGLLVDSFKLTFFSAYNFFPKTPHIETLAILEPK